MSSQHDSIDGALRRVLQELHEGLRHGYFDYKLTCELIGHGRRRLQLRAGKNYMFVIPAEQCETVCKSSSDLRDEGALGKRS